MQVIEVEGEDGFAQGRAYGRAVAPVLWASYLTLFERRAHVGEAEARRTGAAVLDLVQGWRPALVAEMEGVAEGADVAAELVAALNARSEIVAGGTVASVLMDPAAGTLLAGCGPPCRAELQRCPVRGDVPAAGR